MKFLSLSEQQQRLKEMLVEFDAFCKERHITYFLAFGTLLGAIRHNDFIPWDDDVDILLPRADYERLLKYKSISNEVDIVSFISKEYYHPFVQANLVDRKTRRLSHSTRIDTSQGLYIDLFPLDNFPNKQQQCKKMINKVTRLNGCKSLAIQKLRRPSNMKEMLLNSCAVLARFFDPIKLVAKADMIAKQYQNSKTKNVGLVWVNNAQWPAEWFAETTRARFGEYDFSIPVEYDKVLKKFYGDYMQLPPESDRICKHPADVYWR